MYITNSKQVMMARYTESKRKTKQNISTVQLTVLFSPVTKKFTVIQ